MPRLLDIDEAAALLRLRPSTIYKLSCSRRIPVVKLGGRILFDEDRLAAWVAEHVLEPIAIEPKAGAKA